MRNANPFLPGDPWNPTWEIHHQGIAYIVAATAKCVAPVRLWLIKIHRGQDATLVRIPGEISAVTDFTKFEGGGKRIWSNIMDYLNQPGMMAVVQKDYEARLQYERDRRAGGSMWDSWV